MAQGLLNTSEAVRQNHEMFANDIDKDELKVGLLFPSENAAVEAILRWGEKSLCPLMKARRDKGLAETEGKRRGRRCLDCPHGRNRKANRELRPNRAVKFTKCPVTVVVNENDDGTWVVSKTVLEHFGHSVTKKDYYMHEHTKRLDDGDKEYVKELLNAKANASNIATCLNKKTGKNYNGQDVRNLIKKIGESDLSTPKAEEILGRIKDAGGVVSYTRDSNNFVDVLWIQTADMVDMLKKERPRLFQHDTTFGEFCCHFSDPV